MQIIKHKESKIKKDYFYFTGKVDLNEKYFLDKIKEGCSSPDNMNYVTNIKGKQTQWKFFNNDNNFLKIVELLISYIDNNLKLPDYHLAEAWGFELSPSEKTMYHDHHEALWSGVIYLNSSSQTLNFPEIQEKLKPEIGSFAVFSSCLKHGCERNKDQSSKFGISFNINQTKPW